MAGLKFEQTWQYQNTEDSKKSDYQNNVAEQTINQQKSNKLKIIHWFDRKKEKRRSTCTSHEYMKDTFNKSIPHPGLITNT